MSGANGDGAAPGSSAGGEAGGGASPGAADPNATAQRSTPPGRKSILLRLNAPVYDAIARWARDDLRSVNAQIEFLLRRALEDAGRAPSDPGPLPRRGRPPR
ncbi:MAG: hypothetical protein LBC97_01000 [Bifidobacteriaceae bacterium]|jgi:hypothetical protein|nr:hypothetical protein [Bifidobacteriaceae bacterium]